MAVTLGIFAAGLINYGTRNMVEGWRVSLALGGCPALMLFIGSIFLPDTPNSLVARGQLEQARAVLAMVRGTDAVDAEFMDIQEAVHAASAVPNPYRNIIKR